MSIRTEVNLRLPNSPGALAGVCQLLSDERVNITAMALDATGQLGNVADRVEVSLAGVPALREAVDEGRTVGPDGEGLGLGQRSIGFLAPNGDDPVGAFDANVGFARPGAFRGQHASRHVVGRHVARGDVTGMAGRVGRAGRQAARVMAGGSDGGAARGCSR